VEGRDRIGTGFVRRIDVLAAVRPKVIKLYLWFFGLMIAWAALGLIASLAARHWGVATIFAVAIACSGSACLALLGARRRAPETWRSLEQIRGS
jgi:hypothetical protein